MTDEMHHSLMISFCLKKISEININKPDSFFTFISAVIILMITDTFTVDFIPEL